MNQTIYKWSRYYLMYSPLWRSVVNKSASKGPLLVINRRVETAYGLIYENIKSAK